MIKFGVFIIILSSLLPAVSRSQDEHAVEGSPYAGSLGVANNPASILSTPYPWDITVFSVQGTTATNLLTVYNFSLLSPADSSKYAFNNGQSKRYVNFNFNIHLLNARIAFSRRSAIAFGANLRGYGIGRTSSYDYVDTLHNLTDFFGHNTSNMPFSANLVSSSWVELFATYSKTLIDNEAHRFNAGVTIHAMRGLSGGQVTLEGGAVHPSSTGGHVVYTLDGGSIRYAYSSTYDTWQKGNSTSENLQHFLTDAHGDLAIDLGWEYYIKTQAVNVNNDDDYYDYEWKIGGALLDIGENQYEYGSQSRLVVSPKPNITDSTLNQLFSAHFSNLAQINDSVRGAFINVAKLNGIFKIRNPVRAVLNIDRPLRNDFAVNLNISLNITGYNKGKALGVQELNLLTLTPRWETRRWGVYFPIQYNTEGQLLVGGAFKAGPLLLGIHNWGNVFSSQSIQNGGGYIALVIRPGSGFREKEEREYTCPKPIN